ncbi:MAG: hypothetical protein Q9M26_01880 [Mariprofundales bacterium]|nr:hypothetical protein [Mariprofundales bacterium]
MHTITSQLLSEKGYISMVDLFVRLGYLTDQDVHAWRMKRIPYLERCIHLNLRKISQIVKTVRKHSMQGNLKASYTAYKLWGKGAKQTLRFSKFGQEQIEKAYATHFLKPRP